MWPLREGCGWLNNVHILIPRICECFLKCQKKLYKRFEDLEMRRLSWIFHVGPYQRKAERI